MTSSFYRRLLVAAVLLLVSIAGGTLAPAAAAAQPPAAAPASEVKGTAPAKKLTFRLGFTAVVVAGTGPDWTDKSSYQAGTLKTIRLVRDAAGTRRAKLMLTPLVPLQKRSQLVSPEQMRKAIEERASAMGSGVAEKQLKVDERSAREIRLVYFSATDPNPKPGEFLRMTEGLAVLRDVPFSFTLLYDEPAVREEILAAIGRWSIYGVADRAGDETRPDMARLAKACERNDGLACGLLAEFSRTEQSSAEDSARRRQLLEAGCKNGSAFACGSLGAFHAEGKGVPREEDKGLALFERACDAHSALGCMNAARLRGRRLAGTTDPKARAVLERLVDRACGFGGDREGICRISDEGSGARDESDYFRRQGVACAANSGRACRLLGWALETGYGTPVDEKAAHDAYGRACSATDLWGCFRQALLTAEITEQTRLYEQACKQGSGPACYDLALAPYGRTEAQRTDLLRRACESDIREACMQVLATLSR